MLIWLRFLSLVAYTKEVITYTPSSLAGKCILLATILASGMAFLDGSVVTIAIPSLQKLLNASLADIQWVINGYALFLCALILISGALGDKFGRKKVFTYGIGIFVFSSLLCGLSHSILQLILFRCIQGIGGAMMVPGSLSIIDASFAPAIRGRVIGIWSGFAGGLSAIGPFAGGWLVQYFGWQSIFFLNIPLGLLALFLTIRFVPESKNPKAKRIDIIGSLLIFFSLLGITYGLIVGSDNGWSNPFIVSSLIGGVILFVFFLRIQVSTREPLVPLHILRAPLVSGANIVTFFLYFALSGVIFFLVLNFQQVQNYSPLVAGLAILPTILLITFFSSIGGWVADTSGPRIPMIVGPLIVAVGMFFLSFSGLHANYFFDFLPGLLLFGIGMALVIAPLTKSALAVTEEYAGAASGINNAVARIAGLLAVAILGGLVLVLFKMQLTNHITQSALPIKEQQQILLQDNKLTGIEIPYTFSQQARYSTQTQIATSFLYGFRFAMGTNALLALLSSIVAFKMIHNEKKKG